MNVRAFFAVLAFYIFVLFYGTCAHWKLNQKFARNDGGNDGHKF